MTNNKAVIHFAGDEMFLGISPSGHAVAIDTKNENKTAPTPVELLMIAVGGCTAVDVISILQKKRQNVTDYRVEVSAERNEEHPRFVKKFLVHHIVHGRGVSPAAVQSAIQLSDEKYCSVAATVKPTAEVVTTFEIVESSEYRL